MPELCQSVPLRIVVTGARGKSSLTRLLHAGLSACGLRSHARITGVSPRALSPAGERRIIRSAPAHIEEMRWWLRQIPPDAQAVVVENSAVAPELQPLASQLVRPLLVVWTNVRPDHTEVWGPGREGASKALVRGVPDGIPVAGGGELDWPPLRALLEQKNCALHTVSPRLSLCAHRAENLALAHRALVLCAGLSGISLNIDRAVAAMETLAPDIADFRVLRDGEDELAVAFSANDAASTARLFAETGWREEETTVLYHHRPDRDARLAEFRPWLWERPWKERTFTRSSRPWFSWGEGAFWNDAVDSPESFQRWRQGRGRVFACGNVAGWPLRFLCEKGEEA